jgi:hypothetical protein
LAPSLVGIFPYAGIDLMANSVLKEALTERYQRRGVEPGVVELLGRRGLRTCIISCFSLHCLALLLCFSPPTSFSAAPAAPVLPLK